MRWRWQRTDDDPRGVSRYAEHAAGEERSCSSLIHTREPSRYTIIVFEFTEEPAELSLEAE
jgi:hypothetical protein